MARILVDMDGVLANYEQGFFNNWRSTHPSKPYITLNKRNTFYPEDQYPTNLKNEVEQIPLQKGFFLNLPPINGGKKALEEMILAGHEVYICTSPMTNNPYCASEKLAWMENNFGPRWKRKTIITKDKTLVSGDYLIDDRPTVEGIAIPSWEHIHYLQPYNNHLPNRKLTWSNWKEIIK